MLSGAPSDRIDIFLHTLRSERHLRSPLLAELADRLTEAGLPAAANAARELLDALAHGAVDFDAGLAGLERLVRARPRDAA
jgi:hypothetical protein